MTLLEVIALAIVILLIFAFGYFIGYMNREER